MNQSNDRPDPDAVGRALDLVAERWTFLVLREAYFGVRRYGFFQRNLGISRSVLAARLSELVSSGMLKRVRYRSDPDWFEYRLTKASFELFPIILMMKSWAELHILDPAEHKLEVHHCACGAELKPIVVCESCHAPITADDVDYEVSSDPLERDGTREPERGVGRSRPSGERLRRSARPRTRRRGTS
jgi:DNA-binding HxlR family transcriptional regulator